MSNIRCQVFIHALLVGLCLSGDPITDEGSRIFRRSTNDLDVISNADEMKDCLDAHNAVRSSHGAPDLVWDETLAAGAASYARTLAQPGSTFQHSAEAQAPGGPGENLFSGLRGKKKPPYDVTAAVCNWYGENKCYDYKAYAAISGCGNGMVGHFTQVVWKGTKKLGCARSSYIGEKMIGGVKRTVRFTYLVARYDPAGNDRSQNMALYADNVGTKKSDSGTCPTSA